MKALIFDTETTDLISNTLLADKHQPRVIEFFGQIVEDDGTILDNLEFRCNPGIVIPPKITEITGITNDDVKDEPPFAFFEPRIRKLMEQAQAVVAHNLSYDFTVMNMEMNRIQEAGLWPWPKIKICTVEETEHIKGHRLNLTSLHEHLFGVGFANAHSARHDVEALTRCWLQMRAIELV